MKYGERPLCYGTHGESNGCLSCAVKPECINYKTGSGEGTLMASLEEFGILYDIVVRGLEPDELELLDELIESGGYIASTEDDYYFAGKVPDKKQLEAEKRMEIKMREFMCGVNRENPKVWRAYSIIVHGLNPVGVALN